MMMKTLALVLSFSLCACDAKTMQPTTNEFGWPLDHSAHRRMLSTLALGASRKLQFSSVDEYHIKGCFIVTLRKDDDIERRQLSDKDLYSDKLRQQCAGKKLSIVRTYANIDTLALCASPECIKEILVDDVVAEVEQDEWIEGAAAQMNPTWALDRIDQQVGLDSSYDTGDLTGEGVDIYILDTGINTKHSEYADRFKGGKDLVGDGHGYEDCNGHGTHCAGIAAGNTYGVAKKANLWGVRVLSCSGFGSASGVIAGLDWVVSNVNQTGRPSVVSMSLTGSSSNALGSAVKTAVAAHIPVVVAAGNANADACNFSPGNEPAAITVAATTAADSRASFSNFGSCIDIFAPGVAIESSWVGGDDETKTLSGTSAACPLVAGAAALEIQLMQREGLEEDAAAVSTRLTTRASAGLLSSVWYGSPNLLLRTSSTEHHQGIADLVTSPIFTVASHTAANAQDENCACGEDAPCLHDTIGDNTCHSKYMLFGDLVCPAGTTECHTEPKEDEKDEEDDEDEEIGSYIAPTLSPTQMPTIKTSAPTPAAMSGVKSAVDQGTIDNTDEDANDIENTPAPTPAPAPGWTVSSGGEHCKQSLTLNGFCVQDTGDSYGGNEDCEFTYSGSATLTREEWHLEPHSACQYDYLEVDGVKYCGDDKHVEAFPTTLEVSGTTTFKFSTDHSLHFSGFKICDNSGWKVTSRSAGTDASVQDASTGICQVKISSSGLCVYDDTGVTPMDYSTHVDCEFNFLGNGVLDNKEFQLEAHSSCDWDYLEVDGQRHCGTNLPSVMSVVGSTPFNFHSDYSVTSRGFQICYKPDWFDYSRHDVTATSSFSSTSFGATAFGAIEAFVAPIVSSPLLEEEEGVTAPTAGAPTFDVWVANGKQLPSDMMFAGGSPFFDETSGKTRSDREVYAMLYPTQAPTAATAEPVQATTDTVVDSKSTVLDERSKLLHWMWSDPKLSTIEAMVVPNTNTGTHLEMTKPLVVPNTNTETHLEMAPSVAVPTKAPTYQLRSYLSSASQETTGHKTHEMEVSELRRKGHASCGVECQTGAALGAGTVFILGSLVVAALRYKRGSGTNAAGEAKIDKQEPQPVAPLDLERTLISAAQDELPV